MAFDGQSVVRTGGPTTVLLTGASSGIGAALARRYAHEGVTLVLWGRDEARLAVSAQACTAKGARVTTRALDLRDGPAALAALAQDDERVPFDLVVLCAGVGDIRNPADATEDPQRVLDVALVNYAVPSALATLAARRMVARGGGQIALVGSVAAFHDLPFASAYCGSKAGLARFASALRISLAPQGVRLSLISPGFVDTAMSRRLRGPRPFLVDVDRAAQMIAHGLARNEAHMIFPWPFGLLRVLDMLMPRFLRDRLMGRMRAEQLPAL
jgi:short-subunit dehydrogenase